jgi:mono/diheme cytochrome c family protein
MITRSATRAMTVAVVTLVVPLSLLCQSGPATGVSSTTQVAQSGAPLAGTADKGRLLFKKVGCYECHGTEAQGSLTTTVWSSGPRLGPNPMPFRLFARYVRHAPNAPKIMPPYTTKVLSDQDLADIYAFLQSVAPAVPIDEVPVLEPSSESQPKKPEN